MAITLTNDPILALDDVMALLDLKDEREAKLLINAMSERFKAFTHRIQLNKNIDTAIVEHVNGSGEQKLFLHCAPIHVDDGDEPPAALDLTAEVISGAQIVASYSLANEDFEVVSSDQSAHLFLNDRQWPQRCSTHYVKVTYYGGWASVPGDVTQSCILQARMDLKRMQGLIGVTSISRQNETTSYESGNLAKAVAQVWQRYKVLSS